MKSLKTYLGILLGILLLAGCGDSYYNPPIENSANWAQYNSNSPVRNIFIIYDYGGTSGNSYFHTLTVVGGCTPYAFNNGFNTSTPSILVSINLYSASRYGIGAGVYSVSKSMYSGSIPYASSIYYPEGTVGSISDKATYSSGTLMVTNLDGYYSMVGNFQTADGDSLLIQFSGSLYEYGYSYTQAKKFEVEEP